MFQFVIDGWPLLPIVIGLVEFIKRLFPNMQGRLTTLVAFLLGSSLGAGYLWTQAIPATYQTWFVFIVGILVYGLVPLGLYGVSTKSYQFQKENARNARLDMISNTTPPMIQHK
jgi:hypothetical protein